MALKSLKDNKEIKIPLADEGNCTVVLNESTCKKNISSLLKSGVCEILRKDPTFEIERMIRKLIIKHKTVLPAALQYKMTPYHSKPLYLHGLPRYTNLASIISSTKSLCYALANFLHKILSPIVGITKSSEHFIKLI
jgi:hypothetical protein